MAHVPDHPATVRIDNAIRSVADKAMLRSGRTAGSGGGSGGSSRWRPGQGADVAMTQSARTVGSGGGSRSRQGQGADLAMMQSARTRGSGTVTPGGGLGDPRLGINLPPASAPRRGGLGQNFIDAMANRPAPSGPAPSTARGGLSQNFIDAMANRPAGGGAPAASGAPAGGNPWLEKLASFGAEGNADAEEARIAFAENLGVVDAKAAAMLRDQVAESGVGNVNDPNAFRWDTGPDGVPYISTVPSPVETVIPDDGDGPVYSPEAIACSAAGNWWDGSQCINMQGNEDVQLGGDDFGGGGDGFGGGGGDPYASAINLDQYRRPADLERQIRDLMGERQTQDFSQDIRDMIAGRRTGLTEAEARRMGQIGDIETQLGGDIGALETDRLAQQQALIDAVTGRAGGLTTGIQDRLTGAREALGPQVTDEFEQVAQLVGGLGASQATSSQDAMSRLAQVANMAGAARGAAPGQLAAESKLALGDEAFRMFQGLDQEQTQRLLSESMRQEDFNTRRDEDMVNALLGDVGRREDFLVRETERQQGMDYGRGERIEGQQFQTGERIGAQDWRTGEREAAQIYGTGERTAGEAWRGGQAVDQRTWQGEQAVDQRTWQGEQAVDERTWREGESDLDRKARTDAATDAWDRSVTGATTAYDRQVLREEADRDWRDTAIKTETERATSAAEAEAAGNNVAAQFYGLGPEGAVLWGQMGTGERKAVRDRHLADLDLLGEGGFAQGSMERMTRRYGEDQSVLIGHAETLLKLYPDIRDAERGKDGRTENEKQRDVFYAGLMEGDPITGSGGLSRSKIETIKQFFAEMQTGQRADRLQARQAALRAEAEYWIDPGAKSPGTPKAPPAPPSIPALTGLDARLGHLAGTDRVAPISPAPNQPQVMPVLQATGQGPRAQAQQAAMDIINADPNAYIDMASGTLRDSKGRSVIDIMLEQQGG